jgi:aminoglycoside phosphotransferase (APT) family kinase protein
MWFHSDLRGDNLIVHSGRLVAVIDWEGCTVADPSADYLAGWWLFDRDSRETFRSASNADRSDWLRAKGWALHMAVAAIPYYADSNPVFVAQARNALDEILSDPVNKLT